MPAEIDFLSIPIRNTKSFLNHDLIKLNQPNTGGAIESIFIMNNSLLAVSNPLQLTEYHNFINNSPPARIVFKYPHWETTSSAISTTNQLFATTLSDGTICIWDTSEWGAPYQLQYSDKKAEVVIFSQSGLVLFAGFSDGTIEFLDSNTFEIINTDNISDNLLESNVKKICLWPPITYLFMYNQALAKQLLSDYEFKEEIIDSSRYLIWNKFRYAYSRKKSLISLIKDVYLKKVVVFRHITSVTPKYLSQVLNRYIYPLLMVGKTYGTTKLEEMTQLSNGNAAADA